VSALGLAPMLLAAAAMGAPPAAGIPWDMAALCAPPALHDAPGFQEEGVRALFYDGLLWRGQPTRVFAWYGAPADEPGTRLPAMVLVHGGGGTAFAEWVRLWTARGYAAIAMDTCGCTAGGETGKRPRHPDGGPPGWGGFDQTDEPITDQWTYHAVADVVLAHSLIRSFPEVDPDRVGLTGISWGGYLTCIVAGVDTRFRFAAPVYGCGFLGEDSAWLPQFAQMGEDRARRWLELWDPARYLGAARLPMLWVTGTNDFAYPLGSLQKSYRLPPAAGTLCIRVRMPHAHGGPGENPAEIHAFAERLCRGGAGLPRVLEQGHENGTAWVRFDGGRPVVRAELNVTSDAGAWQERAWVSLPAELDAASGRAAAALPADALVYYFNLFDADGLAVSSEHQTVPAR